MIFYYHLEKFFILIKIYLYLKKFYSKLKLFYKLILRHNLIKICFNIKKCIFIYIYLITRTSIECKSVSNLTITDAKEKQMTDMMAINKPNAGILSGHFFFALICMTWTTGSDNGSFLHASLSACDKISDTIFSFKSGMI